MYIEMVADGIQFDWDDANVSHVQRHSVSPVEAEEAILNDPVEFHFDRGGDEPRWAIVGRTNHGRFLVVVFTERGAGLRVVTAFEATKRDVALYFGRKGGL